MTLDSILAALGDHPWASQITVLDTVDSTNTFAKALAAQGAPHGTVVLADCQTGGRGRLGRSFSSPRGLGLYLSVVLRFSAPPDRLMNLTCVAAEAVRRAILQACGLDTQIKWINDLVFGKRKLCGILTELVTTPEGPAVICGIGVNCRQQPWDFPPEVADMATSVAQLTGQADRSALAAAILRQLRLAAADLPHNAAPWMEAYRAHCVTLGKDVKLVRDGTERLAHVDGMDDQGALLVTLTDGTTETIFSGEASVRGMYGYLS